jgi:hypothetical protein
VRPYPLPYPRRILRVFASLAWLLAVTPSGLSAWSVLCVSCALGASGCGVGFTDRVQDKDAGRRKQRGECVAAPRVRCEAGAQGSSGLSCAPSASSGLASTLTDNVAVGCEVDFTYADPLPRTGECYIEERCTCEAVEGLGRWSCRR